MFNLSLDPNFKSTNFVEIPHELFRFPAGEPHIKIKGEHWMWETQEITVVHRLKNAQSIIELLLATDAIKRRFKGAKISAYIPYIPFSRQDRPMIGGEPFSLKVFADLINSQKYEKISVLEPHSDVSGALIDNLEKIFPYYLLDAAANIHFKFGDYVLCSPDGGALKRIYDHAKIIGYKGDILCATKIRDVSTGKIIRTTVDATDEQIKGKTIIIDDDIASYSNTFMSLAKVLKNRGAKHVILIVAHYEDVADETKLKESGIDHIFTTNSISNKTSEFITKSNINK